MKMPFQNASSVFGLDIGFESLKLVQIEKHKGEIRLVGAVEYPLADKILDRDRFKNKADTANLIKEMLKKAKPHAITARRIISALPETFVFSKTVKMPKMTKKEYLAAIPNEIADLIPISIDDMYFDYQILVARPDEPLNDILIVATPKHLVDDYVEMARLADLELVALETKPVAVGRAIIGPKDKGGIMVIHIGTEYSRIGIWDDGNLKLTTTVNTGHNQLLESLGHISEKSNEKPDIKLDDETKKDITIPLNNIVTEALNAIKYHHDRSYNPKPIEKIILCGSATFIDGMDVMIEEAIKIKTEVFKTKLQGKDTLPPQHIAALGLALRGENE